jgi:[acyl-carrier-protein] S-malonyltransferase
MWAALFPGQGSQTVGMGRFLYENFAVARELFEEAGDTLKLDFKKLCFEGPESDLQLTENTQPALLLVSTVTFRVLQSLTTMPIKAAAGHSIGEYAAVVTAGGMSFVDGLRAVRIRGQAMQKAVPVGQGGMLAVMGLTEPQVIHLCDWAEKTSGLKPIEPANFNAPGQIVISGSLELCDWLCNWLRTNPKPEIFAPESPRLKLIPLNVSAPFHCSLMKPAEQEMRRILTDIKFSDTNWPIVQNFTAQETKSADVVRENLILQVSGPVRWTQCAARLKELGIEQMIEFGAGRVLTGLAKKIDSSSPSPFNINSLEELKNLENILAKGNGT